jgi:hypothetical protein
VAPRKTVEPVVLDADDIWEELVSSNVVPPLKVGGIVLPQPTTSQVEAWRASKSAEEGERALFGAQYDAVKAKFAEQPEYVWENFNVRYLQHMFGVGDDASLKG